MIYLLDTNTCVEYLRSRNQAVISRLKQEPARNICMCTVVLAELLYGAKRSADPTRNTATAEAFAARFQSLSFDGNAAQVYADVRADLDAKGTPIGPNDLLIAAIALANQLTLVTHNTAEFSRVSGLALEDWQGP